MWSLILMVYLNGAIGVTHIDNFMSERMCEQAGKKAIVKSHDYFKDKVRAESYYVCVLEIK